MDVVGGVIVAADHKDDRGAYRSSSSRRGVKRGRCCGGGDADGKGAAMVAWADEPWRSGGSVKKTTTGGDEVVDLHEDYELHSVLSLYRPTPVLSLQPAKPVPAYPPPPGRSWVDPLRFLFRKELTVTDVGDLGRIILPKRDAECQLPHLDSKEGKLLNMEDYNSNKNWTLRYKWWPNNKSRMYVLESTGEFVKYYELKEKDELIVYKDGRGHLVIQGRKWPSPPFKTTDSFGLRGLTPTGKRSPKGRSNLSKTSSSNTNTTTAASTTMTTTATASTTTTSVLSTLTTSVLSTTSVFTSSSYGVNVDAASNEIVSMAALAGPSSIVGPSFVASDGAQIIDWEKLPDPPAIEFSDPPAIEFPGEFECTWGDII